VSLHCGLKWHIPTVNEIPRLGHGISAHRDFGASWLFWLLLLINILTYLLTYLLIYLLIYYMPCPSLGLYFPGFRFLKRKNLKKQTIKVFRSLIFGDQTLTLRSNDLFNTLIFCILTVSIHCSRRPVHNKNDKKVTTKKKFLKTLWFLDMFPSFKSILTNWQNKNLNLWNLSTWNKLKILISFC